MGLRGFGAPNSTNPQGLLRSLGNGKAVLGLLEQSHDRREKTSRKGCGGYGEHTREIRAGGSQAHLCHQHPRMGVSHLRVGPHLPLVGLTFVECLSCVWRALCWVPGGSRKNAALCCLGGGTGKWTKAGSSGEPLLLPSVGPSTPGPEEKERQPEGKASAVLRRQAISPALENRQTSFPGERVILRCKIQL